MLARGTVEDIHPVVSGGSFHPLRPAEWTRAADTELSEPISACAWRPAADAVARCASARVFVGYRRPSPVSEGSSDGLDEQGCVGDVQVRSAGADRQLASAGALVAGDPHLVIVNVLQTVAEVLAIVSWFVILFTGKLPPGLATFQAMYLQHTAHRHILRFLARGVPAVRLRDGQRRSRDDPQARADPQLVERNRLTRVSG